MPKRLKRPTKLSFIFFSLSLSLSLSLDLRARKASGSFLHRETEFQTGKIPQGILIYCSRSRPEIPVSLVLCFRDSLKGSRGETRASLCLAPVLLFSAGPRWETGKKGGKRKKKGNTEVGKISSLSAEKRFNGAAAVMKRSER